MSCLNVVVTFLPIFGVVGDPVCEGPANGCVPDEITMLHAKRMTIRTTPSVYHVSANDTKCPHSHEDRLFRSPTLGSNSITVEQCYEQCAATEGCNHFSHGAYQGGLVCMGCTTLENAQTDDGFTAYDMAFHLSATDTKCPHNHEDRLFRNPLSGSNSITVEQCYEQCAATEGCNHFSHGAYQGGLVCMGCTTFENAQPDDGFMAYDMSRRRGTTTDGCLTSNFAEDENPTTHHTDPDFLAAVRCCSDDGTCQSQNLPGSVKGPVFGVDGADTGRTQACINEVTFEEAESICQQAGRRLCSVAELHDGQCCDTGCWHNHRAIWTS